MLSRVVSLHLILFICAVEISAQYSALSYRVPDPEEMFEAFQEGFLDLQDYNELLEISRRGFISPGDSIFLSRFPDLLAGISSNPLLITDEYLLQESRGNTAGTSMRRQTVLLRQYHRVKPEGEQKRLYRFHSMYGRLSLYGEYENQYSGSRRWCRRYLEYCSAKEGEHRYSITIGNYKQRLGMGLIYGYHGRLISYENDKSEAERILFSGYGGANGILFVGEKGEEEIIALFDSDLNDTHGKSILGVSAPIMRSSHKFQISAAYGRVRNRTSGEVAAVPLLSLYGYTRRSSEIEYEIAISDHDRHFAAAAALQLKCRRKRSFLSLTAWRYDRHYPAFFTGGPSSRRSQSMTIDDIDLDYRDRYRGESGTVAKSTFSLSRRSRMHTAIGYAWRGADDNRIEAQIGFKRSLRKGFRVKTDCYWRADRLYSASSSQQRVQLELVRDINDFRTRLVCGYRFDKQNMRNDYLVLLENRIRDRLGSMEVTCKFDRLRLSDLKNNYLYLTVSRDVMISVHLHTYVKYSHRYRKGEPGSSYGIFRWELNWTFE